MEQRVVRVGVSALVWKENKIALIKRVDTYGTGTWAPPGGHLEFGELAIENAQRETAEEIGVTVKNLEILGFTEDLPVEYDTHYINIWVQCNWESGELKKSDKEFTESGFFDINHLPMPLFISFKNFMSGKIEPKNNYHIYNSALCRPIE